MWYLFQRFMQMLVILAILSIALFGMLSAMPGNPVDMLITSNPNVKPEDIIRLKKLRGLDKPWFVQYIRWVWGFPEPAEPPRILPFEPFITDSLAEMSEVKVDLSNNLIDPNYIPDEKSIKLWLKQLWPDWALSDTGDEIERAITGFDMPSLLLLLADKDLLLQNSFLNLLQKKSATYLKVQGLFGAQAEGLNVVCKHCSSLEPIWFLVTNSYGQKQVGFVIVSDAKNKISDKPLIKLPIATRIVENEKKPFELDLKKFAINDLYKDELRFKLHPESSGQIDEQGIYRHHFKGNGQDIVMFEVWRDNKEAQKVAFAVEHGVIGHEKKFNKGFIFFFAGDRGALGFSQTYKRPVYDLLFGAPAVCGNEKIEPGETCDDGNNKGGDACDEHCFKKGQSYLAKADAFASGYIVSAGRIGNTIQLMLPALLLSLLIAIPLGIFSAYRQYSVLDYIVNFLAFIGISLPVFWFGIMMMYVFAEAFQLFPAGGVQTPGIYGEGTINIFLDRLKHAVLPTVVLAIFFVGRWLRYMRASMLEVLPKDYIRTARAKGLSEFAVIMKHAFRNALIPVVTVLALSIPALFGGAVLTETVFSWPGVGRLQYESVMNSDYYVAIVVFLVAAILVMLGNLVADALYVLVDPRIRKK